MITVELVIKDKQGNEIAREIMQDMPCNNYEIEIEGFGSFQARVTEWYERDGKLHPKL